LERDEALSTAERRVVDEIAGRRDELIGLLTDLIAFDTTAREVDDPPRDEAALQGYLAGRLSGRRCGHRPVGATARGRREHEDGAGRARHRPHRV